MFDKMKELMEMKKQADRIKKELDHIVIDVEEVSGIAIKINGSQNFREITVSEEMLTPENKSRLEKDLLRSLNAAVKQSQKKAAQQMSSAMPKIPGMNF
ncbi:MAG: YbaB/EbfC family nucleoid-associated protein [Candidatus Omnitrophota bacterium]